MSTYGPQDQPPKSPDEVPPAGASHQPSGAEPYPRQQLAWDPSPRRRPTSILVAFIGGLGLLLVALVGIVVILTTRSESPDASGAQNDRDPTVAELTGQVRQTTDALTAKGLQCWVRFETADGGHAGCSTAPSESSFQSFEASFQYRLDGTVIGLSAQSTHAEGTSEITQVGRLIQTIAPIVFRADQAKVMAASKSGKDTTVEGSWGKFRTRSAPYEASLAAGKAGAEPIPMPKMHLKVNSGEPETTLQAQGFECEHTSVCIARFGFEGGGIVTIESGGAVNEPGVAYLVVSVSDKSRFADPQEIKKVFYEHIDSTFALIPGPPLPQVKGWLDQHRDDRSRTDYVAGWRIDLRVDTGENGVEGYRAHLSTSDWWNIPRG